MSQPSNTVTIEAWNGVLFDRFVRFRDIVTTGLSAHGERGLRLHPPEPGDRTLDVGCGFGDTTRQLAELVGPQGEAVGVDAAPRFIDTARREATQAGVANARFLVADIQACELGGGFDYVFSRFGTMFFANPVVALRNVRQALVPGGRLCMVVWRRKLDNDWLHRAERVVERSSTRPEGTDEPTCGPGPFSMAGADTTTDVLVARGIRRHLPASLRHRDHDRRRPRPGGRVRHGARSRGRADPPSRHPRRATSPGHRRSPASIARRAAATRPNRATSASLHLGHRGALAGSQTMIKAPPRLDAGMR